MTRSGARTGGLRRQLLAGYLAPILQLALASTVAVLSARAVAAALDRDQQLDHGKHDGHLLAMRFGAMMLSQERLIHGERVPIESYSSARDDAARLSAALAAQVEGAAERRAMAEAAELIATIDGLFREDILPAVHTGRAEHARDLERRSRALADRVAAHIEQAIGELELRSAEAGASAERVARRLVPTVLACLGGAVLLAVVLGLRSVAAVAAPVRALEAGARRVAAGDLTTRVELGRDDELGALAAAFNSMAADLGHQQDELVEARKLASVGELAAGVAHEINNPLGVVRGHVRLLMEAEPEPAERERALATVTDEVDRASAIVAQLLDLARPQRLLREPVDLVELAGEAVARAREAAGDVELALAGDAAPCPVEADPGRLRQLIDNLVANAVSACGARGRVTLTVGADGDDARLAVTDTGPGIDRAIAGKLFEPFVTARADGTGLGLFVAQTVAAAHGGRLEAGAGADGEGARFTLRLPRKGGER